MWEKERDNAVCALYFFLASVLQHSVAHLFIFRRPLSGRARAPTPRPSVLMPPFACPVGRASTSGRPAHQHQAGRAGVGRAPPHGGTSHRKVPPSKPSGARTPPRPTLGRPLPTRAPATRASAGGGSDGGDRDPKPQRPRARPPASGPAAWTTRERWVVAGLAAGALLVGPRLALLGAVALERTAVGVALALERALSTAFLSAFSLLAAGAGIALAGAAVYFFVLEVGRLGAGGAGVEEEEDEDEEEED